MRSGASTMMTATGRSSERLTIREAWIRLEAPNPSQPRITVAPAIPAL